jgi:pteridine reductase
MPRMELDGKTALVTGGARRVGRAIVEELARAGCRVVIHHRESDAEAAALAAALPGAPVVVRADLRAGGAARTIVDAAVTATGRLDILVNSAADYARTPLATVDDAAAAAMYQLNVLAPLGLMREAARAGVASIVNVVDVAAWQPWPSWSVYASTKAALLHLGRCLALELAPKTRVNAVAPGTAIFPAEWDERRRAAQLARIPLAREGRPEDIARAVRYLCEEDYVTGVCLPVDGGVGLR